MFDYLYKINCYLCVCCYKYIHLYFCLNQTHLLFYKDKAKQHLFVSILRNSVVQINKHQVNKNDLFSFSIYYQDTKMFKINEFKLKTKSKEDTERWVCKLKKMICPIKYSFWDNERLNKGKYVTPFSLFPVRDLRNFYLEMCHLEYIIGRYKIRKLFGMLCKSNKDNNNEINDYSSDVINNENAIMNKINANNLQNENECNKNLNEDNKRLSFEEQTRENEIKCTF